LFKHTVVSDAEADALRAEVNQIAAAGPIRALRLRRKLRATPA